MYDKLTIKNVQSHKNTTLEFHSGVNVIVGVTDSGKSVIRRSLGLIEHNKPSGNSIRSHWGGITRVSLTTNGNVISRIKSKKGEIYKLNKQVFKSFGKNVPPEIKAALNMSPDNTQSQLESLFLLNDTPGAVAKHYNEIANLTKISEVRDSLQKDIKGFSQTVKYNEGEIKKAKEQLKDYENLSEIEKEINKAEKIRKSSNKTWNDISHISALIKEYKKVKGEIHELKELIDGEDKVNKCLELISEMKKVVKEMKILHDIINSLESISAKRKELKELAKGKGLVNSALETKKRIKQNNKEIAVLSTLLYSAIETKDETKKLRKTLSEQKEKYDKNFSKLKKCFFCGSKLKSN